MMAAANHNWKTGMIVLSVVAIAAILGMQIEPRLGRYAMNRLPLLGFSAAEQVPLYQDSTAMPAIRSADFIAMIGVNTHLNYTDGHYAQTGKVLSSLDYLGVGYLRDAAPRVGGPGQGSLANVAAAGYKFDFVSALKDGEAQTFASIDNFLTRYPGAIAAIEGPNEIDNFKVSFAGLTGVPAAIRIQQTIFNHVRSNPRYKGIVVYNLTNSTSIAAPADFANVHTYPKVGGEQPFRRIAREIAQQTSTQNGLPVVITETGYADVQTSSGWEGVDQPTQARLMLNLLMDSSKLGIGRVYFYELLDAYPDTTGHDVGKHLGLFGYDFSPKRVATAIHNLTRILGDGGPNARTFQTSRLDHTISGFSSSGSSLLMQKSSGEYAIVLWDEPDIWDENRDVAIKAKDQALVIGFMGSRKNVRIFDPLISDKPIATYRDVTSTKVTVADHPVIVEVSNIT